MTTTTETEERESLHVTFGSSDNLNCVWCDNEIDVFEPETPMVIHVAVKGRGRICRECTEKFAPGGWWEITQALDALDTALSVVPTVERYVMVEMLKKAADGVLARHTAAYSLRLGSFVPLDKDLRFAIREDTTVDQIRSAAHTAREAGFLESADALDRMVGPWSTDEGKRLWIENS